MVSSFDYVDVKFPISKKSTARLKRRIVSALMYLVLKIV